MTKIFNGKKFMTLALAAILTTCGTSIANATTHTSSNGRYSAGFSKSGGYTYANTYSTVVAGHSIDIYSWNGTRVGGNNAYICGAGGINAYAKATIGTYAKYRVGSWSGTIS